MKHSPRLMAALIAAVAFLALPSLASAASPTSTVFVQNDNLGGNHVIAYHRASDGALTKTGEYSAGGAWRQARRLSR